MKTKELDREVLIGNMTENLPILRASLSLTQEELANKIGVSRATVIAIETKKRKMTWNTFLSLVLLFIKNENSNRLLNIMEIYTDELNDFIKT